MAIPGGRGILTSWTYEGDIEKAVEWLPYAQAMLQNYARLGVRCNNSVPVEGVEIRIDTFSGRIHIKAEEGGIYLECGIAELFGTASGNLSSHRPAVIHHTSDVSNEYATPGSLFGFADAKKALPTLPANYKFTVSGQRIANNNRPFNGHGHIDNLTSISVGCFPRFQSHTATAETSNGQLISQQDPLNMYCGAGTGKEADGHGLVEKKRLMMYHPSSLYQGKMQLYIQALYGSTRTDMGIFEAGRPFMAPLFILQKKESDLQPNATLTPLYLDPYGNGYGIVTTEDYRYYLAELGTGHFNFYPLSPSKIGEKWQKILNENKSSLSVFDKLKIECYILSTCSPLEQVLHLSLNDKIEYNNQLFYGWRTNWDCTEGMFIGQEYVHALKLMKSHPYKMTLSVETINYPTEAAATQAIKYISRGMHGNLTGAPTKVDVINFSIEEVAGGDYWKTSAHWTWIPDLSSGGSIVLAPWGNLDGDWIAYDALVYGYYDGIGASSSFQEIRYKSTVVVVPEGSDIPTPDVVEPPVGPIDSTAFWTYSTRIYAGGAEGVLSISGAGLGISAQMQSQSTTSDSWKDGVTETFSAPAAGNFYYNIVNNHHWGEADGWDPVGLVNDVTGDTGNYHRYGTENRWGAHGVYGGRVIDTTITKTVNQKQAHMVTVIPYYDATGFFCYSHQYENWGTRGKQYGEHYSRDHAYTIHDGTGYIDPIMGVVITSVTGILSTHDRPWIWIDTDYIPGSTYNTLEGAGDSNDIVVQYTGANNSAGTLTVLADLPSWHYVLAFPDFTYNAGKTGLLATSRRSVFGKIRAEFVDPTIEKLNEYIHDSALGWA